MFNSFSRLAVVAAVALFSGSAFAVPMTWTYAGVCTGGDCSVVPSISGSISGDPSLFGSSSELNEYVVLGDLFSYTFTVGSYTFSGIRGLGAYTLDSSGNIAGGSMTFGDVNLEFLDVGSAKWTIRDYDENDCFLIFCSMDVEARGTGGYSSSTLPTPVPEPASLCLLGLGLFGIGAVARRRNRLSA